MDTLTDPDSSQNRGSCGQKSGFPPINPLGETSCWALRPPTDPSPVIYRHRHRKGENNRIKPNHCRKGGVNFCNRLFYTSKVKQHQIVLIKKLLPFCVYSSYADLCVYYANRLQTKPLCSQILPSCVTPLSSTDSRGIRLHRVNYRTTKELCTQNDGRLNQD